MSHDDHGHGHTPTEFEGDFEFTNGKLAMWLFLVSDAMAFIGFLGAYMVLRMSTTNAVAPTPEELTLAWKPDWSPNLDLTLTGLNTFVLIISSVTMVKALAAFQDGFQNKGKMFLLATIAGGSFFVGFQVWEWNHLLHEGVTMSGLRVPTLHEAMTRAEKNGSNKTRLGMARELYGAREFPAAWDDAAYGSDEDGNTAYQKAYVNLPIETIDGDLDPRPKHPGVIHMASYSIPAVATLVVENDETVKRVIGPYNRNELYTKRGERIENEGTRYEQLMDERNGLLLADIGLTPAKDGRDRTPEARVANMFSSSFYVLTGFHGFHVFIGVIYLWIIFFRARAGAFGPENNSSVEIVGLYWHFVDLVWVLLFMLIYLL
ncbi:MAG: hypothetical protein CMJ18_21355 [Phycisphaeraceae bacterium]|nr:hypothetical protein [Phycisphaeraceae bacterium]